MNKFIAASVIALSSLGAVGLAQASDQVQQYSYGMHLDIAKVVYITPVPDSCNVEPARMTYEDHQGQRHTIEYKVLGNGCDKN